MRVRLVLLTGAAWVGALALVATAAHTAAPSPTTRVGRHFRHLDAANPALLNHDNWYAGHGWTVPYPGEERVLTPAEVLLRYPDAGLD